MTQRQDKINSLLQREVGNYIAREAFEGITGLLTITRVEVASDLEQAKIYFSIVRQKPEEAAAVLRQHLYQIQGALNKKLVMRKAPRIEFVIDESGEYAARISKLIDDNRQGTAS